MLKHRGAKNGSVSEGGAQRFALQDAAGYLLGLLGALGAHLVAGGPLKDAAFGYAHFARKACAHARKRQIILQRDALAGSGMVGRQDVMQFVLQVMREAHRFPLVEVKHCCH